MNEKTKKIIYFIIGVLFFPIIWLFRQFVHNRKSDDRAATDIQSARKSIKESEDRIEQCITTNNSTRKSIESSITTADEIEKLNGRATELFNEIKNQTAKD